MAHVQHELPSDSAVRVAHVHLVIGPVAAGKSTFALALAGQLGAVRLNLDEWMATLFSADRPEGGGMAWYRERTQRCLTQIWAVAQRVLAAGTPVVLEIGLIQSSERGDFYERVDAAAAGLTVYVLDAPRDVRRERVERRNVEKGATFSMVVPAAIFELASDLWQPPDEEECRRRDVRFQ